MIFSADFSAMRFVIPWLLLKLLSSFVSGNSLSNGLGDHLGWVPWDQAPQLAFNEGKPLMVVLHKSWCPACKSLKAWFAASDVIADLSQGFVMVNADEKQAPSLDPKFNVDGSYVPRIFFLSASGDLMPDVVNIHGNPNYKYFYFDEESVIEAMKTVLTRLGADKIVADKEEL